MNWLLYINGACVLVFVGLLVWASLSDVRVYRIPNWISLAIGGLFLPFVLTSGGSVVHQLVQGYGVGLAVLAVGYVMFTWKIMGGGDAKLLSAIGIWAGLAHLGDALLVLAAVGGLMALAILAIMPLRKRLENKSFLEKIRTTKLPYGVAISAGGFYVAWQLLQPVRTQMGI